MDRTVIPNGDQPEDPHARERLRRFCQLPQVRLAYVSGRDMALVDEAVAAYDLPMADFVISDVGTCICRRENGAWHELMDWQREIAQEWGSGTGNDLQSQLQEVEGLRLQESERQKPFKTSFYLEPRDHPRIIAAVQASLDRAGVEANLVWSIDETMDRGLLDVLPRRASKLHAIRYLQRYLALDGDDVMFAGDSGNDLDVLASDVNAVLVHNATDEVRERAVALARARGNEDSLYLAQAHSALGMNGNYAAGVLQGVLHYAPHFRNVLLANVPQDKGQRSG